MKDLFTMPAKKSTSTKQNHQNAHDKRLLAINFGGIGDEILFLPTLASIKKSFPSWHVTLLLEPRSKSIQQITRLVDNVLTFDIKKRPLTLGDLVDLLSLMRDGNFDAVISSGASPAVSILLFLSGIKQRIGYLSSPLAKLFLTNAVPLVKNQYAGAMYHDLVKGLRISSGSTTPKITVDAESRKAGKAILGIGTAPGNTDEIKRVVIHPGTSKLAVQKGIIKTWAANNWAALIEFLLNEQNLQVVLAGGPDDEGAVLDIMSELKGRGISAGNNFIVAHGKTKSLADLAGLIDASDMLVCVDSAPMHLAVGINKPTVALFAVTDPKRLLPKSNKFVALSNSNHNHPDSSQLPEESSTSSDQYRYQQGVVLPPENVLRTVLDQLSQSANQARSQVVHD